MEKLYIGTLQTDVLGLIGVALTERGLAGVRMFQGGERNFIENITAGKEVKVIPSSEKTAPILDQIKEYLQGERTRFEVAIDWSGLTDFQRAALQATLDIPFGETRSYRDIATSIGQPHAARAVGQAERNNPNPLVIPCHRVIGSDGKLRGYGGSKDVNTKAWLLAFEERVAGKG
ncbi:MAG: methylated-DNA--[protein]-cysteine S-methyltransferase [Anaerolineales bacterium]